MEKDGSLACRVIVELSAKADQGTSPGACGCPQLVEYALIVECRRLDGMEVIIFDAEIEVPQLRVHPIEEAGPTSGPASIGMRYIVGQSSCLLKTGQGINFISTKMRRHQTFS